MLKTYNLISRKTTTIFFLSTLLGIVTGCGSAPPENLTSLPQPTPAVSPSPTKADPSKTDPTPPPVSPPVTVSIGSQTNSQKDSTGASSPSQANKQSVPSSSPSPRVVTTPKISVVPNNTLSPQLVVEQGGKTHTFNAQDLRAEVMGSMNCQKMERVDRQNLPGTNFMRDEVSVDPKTGNIAIGVIFQYCALTQESAVMILQPQANGSYQTAVLQVPGQQTLPSKNSTYPLGYIKSVRYTNGNLLIHHGNAAGTEAELAFRPSGEYLSCRLITEGEGGARFCPAR